MTQGINFGARFASTNISQKMRDIQEITQHAGDRRTSSTMSAGDAVKVYITEAASSQTGVWKSNITNTGDTSLVPCQTSIDEAVSIVQQALEIATRASSPTETLASRTAMQPAITSLIGQIQSIAVGTVNAQGTQLLTGAVLRTATAAAANIELVTADNGVGGIVVAATPVAAYTAFIRVNGGAEALAANGADRTALYSLIANCTTSGEYIAQAFSLLSTVGLDSQAYNQIVSDVIQAQKLAPLLDNAAINAGLALGGVDGALDTVNNARARFIANIINQAVPASSLAATQTGAEAPSAIIAATLATKANAANIAAILKPEDVSALLAYAATGAGGASNNAANGAALFVEDALAVVRQIPCFQRLNALNQLLLTAADASSVFGVTAANAPVANMGVTCNQLLNVILTTAASSMAAAATPVTATYGPSASSVLRLNLPNITSANLGIANPLLVDSTGTLAQGVVSALNYALGLLTGAQASVNAQITRFGDVADQLQDTKDKADSSVDAIVAPNPTAIGAQIAEARRGIGQLVAGVVIDQTTKDKLARAAEEMARG